MLGHIVTELVLNSVQYAHPAGAPGRIEVRCRPIGDGQLMLSVADDGVGLPEGFNAEVDGGLGLDVVRLLVRRLAAEIRFEDGGLGLTVRIVAPYDDAVARPLS
jgi:two-component sensor histidine kinase